MDGTKKLILAFMWQLIRFDVLKMLGDMKEDQLVAWANERVNKPPGIADLRDPVLRTSHFLFDLFGTIERQSINWELVTPGETEEQL